MGSKVRSLAIAFAVGLLGWLSVEVLQLTGELVFFAAFLVGALAGTLTRQPTAIVGLVGGMLVAYPIALAGKLIAYAVPGARPSTIDIGENWAIYLAMASALAVAGFFVARVAGQGRRSGSANAPGRNPPSRDI